MKLGTVVGRVWADRKVPELLGVRLLVVAPVSAAGKPAGNWVAAADPCNLAGSGDTVVFVTSTDAAEALPQDAPVNASVVELVDFVN